MALDFLLQQVKNAVYNDPHTSYQQGDTHGLIDQISGLFGQHTANTGNSGGYGNVQSSDNDPDGDPGNSNSRYGNVKSSDEDPYGDPGSPNSRFGNVKSSDDDPYGDPGANQR